MKKPQVMLQEDMPRQVRQVPQANLPKLTLAQADSVALPSNFIFYDFKDLYIQPFKTRHLAKIIRVQGDASPSHLAEVVDSVLSTSTGETGLAFKLTHEDYMWVLYWLRLNSFNKSKYVVTSKCNNPEHIKQVKQGKLPKDSLKISVGVERSVLECKSLLEDFKLDYAKHMPQDTQLPEGFYLSVPKYQDIIDMTDDPEMKVTSIDPDTGKEVVDVNAGYMYQAAPALMMHWPNATWRDRFNLAGELSADDYQRVYSLAEDIPAYGVEETVTITCPRCGAKRKVVTYVDARNFFPGTN